MSLLVLTEMRSTAVFYLLRSSFILIITHGIDAAETPTGLAQIVGSLVSFQCNYTENEIRWFFNPSDGRDKDIVVNTKNTISEKLPSNRYSIRNQHQQSVITIKDLRKEDAGNYACNDGILEPRQTELIVLGSRPVCFISRVDSGSSSVIIRCNISYSGNFAPTLDCIPDSPNITSNTVTYNSVLSAEPVEPCLVSFVKGTTPTDSYNWAYPAVVFYVDGRETGNHNQSKETSPSSDPDSAYESVIIAAVVSSIVLAAIIGTVAVVVVRRVKGCSPQCQQRPDVVMSSSNELRLETYSEEQIALSGSAATIELRDFRTRVYGNVNDSRELEHSTPMTRNGRDEPISEQHSCMVYADLKSATSRTQCYQETLSNSRNQVAQPDAIYADIAHEGHSVAYERR